MENTEPNIEIMYENKELLIQYANEEYNSRDI